MRIDFIYGTRPELIKMAIPIKSFKSRNEFQVRVISTGQHREMLTPLESWFEIEPDFNWEVMRPNQSLPELGSVLMNSFISYYQEHEKPDWIIVQGDTTTAFIACLMGFYSRVKVAHIEAGLRTWDKYSPWPEEANRQMISKLAEIHFAPTLVDKNNLISEGVKEENILVSGNTVVDSLIWSNSKIEDLECYPNLLSELFRGAFSENRMVLITSHRRENHGEKLEQICQSISDLANEFPEIHFVFPVHPNPIVKDSVQKILGSIKENIWLLEPLNYPEFLTVLKRSFILLTDSGGLQEEAPSFKKPVLLLRENTERGEGVVAGCVKLVGTNKENIIQEVRSLLLNKEEFNKMVCSKNPFGDGNASEKMVQKLLSRF